MTKEESAAVAAEILELKRLLQEHARRSSGHWIATMNKALMDAEARLQALVRAEPQEPENNGQAPDARP